MNRRPRILAIDDDPAQLELLARGLAFEGFEVETREGPIGLTQLVRVFQPDIALVDIYIPTMKGDRIIELIRSAAHPETKYFVISSCSEEDLRACALETNAHGWLPKGLPMNEMALRLRDSLARHRELVGPPSTRRM